MSIAAGHRRATSRRSEPGQTSSVSSRTISNDARLRIISISLALGYCGELSSGQARMAITVLSVN